MLQFFQHQTYFRCSSASQFAILGNLFLVFQHQTHVCWSSSSPSAVLCKYWGEGDGVVVVFPNIRRILLELCVAVCNLVWLVLCLLFVVFCCCCFVLFWFSSSSFQHPMHFCYRSASLFAMLCKCLFVCLFVRFFPSIRRNIRRILIAVLPCSSQFFVNPPPTHTHTHTPKHQTHVCCRFSSLCAISRRSSQHVCLSAWLDHSSVWSVT